MSATMGANARPCSAERRCYQPGCETCDARPCHYPATVRRGYQPTCEIGAGFEYWQLWSDAFAVDSSSERYRVGKLGCFRSKRAAHLVAAAYSDPTATIRSIRAARERAAEIEERAEW